MNAATSATNELKFCLFSRNGGNALEAFELAEGLIDVHSVSIERFSEDLRDGLRRRSVGNDRHDALLSCGSLVRFVVIILAGDDDTRCYVRSENHVAA